MKLAQLSARDVMQKDVLTVGDETPLIDVHRLFVEEEIHGAPVVDDNGNVLGIVTSLDLLRVAEEEHESGRASPVFFLDEKPGPGWADLPSDFEERLGGRTVSEAMTSGVIHVEADTSLPQVARTLQRHKIHRVLVVEGNRFVGLISTFDLVRALAGADE